MAPNLPRGPGKPVTLETLALNLRTYVPLSAFHVGAVARGGCPNKPATGATYNCVLASRGRGKRSLVTGKSRPPTFVEN